MPETFFTLLAGGILLAAAIPDPGTLTLNWLRLAGILSICMLGIAGYFFCTGRSFSPGNLLRRVQILLLIFTSAAALGQVALAQMGARRGQRIIAVLGFVFATLAGANLLHELMIERGIAVSAGAKWWAIALQSAACAGVAAMAGIGLMDMLLGHAYLTASKLTIAPFKRLNLAMAIAIICRAAMAVGVVLVLQRLRPVPLFWSGHGLLLLTRWLVGLAVPALFIFMAHDCIKRRATQSATGILYVAGVLIFVGEIIALYLVRETGLPF